IIGGYTNHLAIKMLFRPHRPIIAPSPVVVNIFNHIFITINLSLLQNYSISSYGQKYNGIKTYLQYIASPIMQIVVKE
ncbi:hypothetical protein ACT4UM_20470, partial [Bacillus sp. SS-TM]